MTLRPAAFATALAFTALVLAGCTPPPAPTESPAPTDSSEATPVATEEPVVQLPADAVLGVTMHATAIATGAELEIQLVLLKPEPIGSAGAAPRAEATVNWCVDELDQSVLTDQNFSFGQLDVTATAVDGTPAWPNDLPLHLIPTNDGSTSDLPSLTAGGGAYSVERPDELNDPAYYVPHCLQDVFLDVPGSGSIYLGWRQDAADLDTWLTTNFGATFDLWGEPVGDPPVKLSQCTMTLTDLGKSLGASDVTFTKFVSDSQCIMVGAAS